MHLEQNTARIGIITAS